MSAGRYWTNGHKFICLRTDSSGVPSYEVVAQRPEGLEDDARYSEAGDWESRSDQIVASLNMLPDLVAALAGMLDRYTALVNCGDCGNWNPETEDEVIAARSVLSRTPDIQIKGAA
jgi:hypothetical protein